MQIKNMPKQASHVGVVLLLAVVEMTSSFLIPTMARRARTLERAAVERLQTSTELEGTPSITWSADLTMKAADYTHCSMIANALDQTLVYWRPGRVQREATYVIAVPDNENVDHVVKDAVQSWEIRNAKFPDKIKFSFEKKWAYRVGCSQNYKCKQKAGLFKQPYSLLACAFKATS